MSSASCSEPVRCSASRKTCCSYWRTRASNAARDPFCASRINSISGARACRRSCARSGPLIALVAAISAEDCTLLLAGHAKDPDPPPAPIAGPIVGDDTTLAASLAIALFAPILEDSSHSGRRRAGPLVSPRSALPARGAIPKRDIPGVLGAESRGEYAASNPHPLPRYTGNQCPTPFFQRTNFHPHLRAATPG